MKLVFKYLALSLFIHFKIHFYFTILFHILFYSGAAVSRSLTFFELQRQLEEELDDISSDNAGSVNDYIRPNNNNFNHLNLTRGCQHCPQSSHRAT